MVQKGKGGSGETGAGAMSGVSDGRLHGTVAQTGDVLWHCMQLRLLALLG